jgi:hypothetical protein
VAIFPDAGYVAAYLGDPSPEECADAAHAFDELAIEARQKAAV